MVERRLPYRTPQGLGMNATTQRVCVCLLLADGANRRHDTLTDKDERPFGDPLYCSLDACQDA